MSFAVDACFLKNLVTKLVKEEQAAWSRLQEIIQKENAAMEAS